jgi:hypothetical protein
MIHQDEENLEPGIHSQPHCPYKPHFDSKDDHIEVNLLASSWLPDSTLQRRSTIPGELIYQRSKKTDSASMVKKRATSFSSKKVAFFENSSLSIECKFSDKPRKKVSLDSSNNSLSQSCSHSDNILRYSSVSRKTKNFETEGNKCFNINPRSKCSSNSSRNIKYRDLPSSGNIGENNDITSCLTVTPIRRPSLPVYRRNSYITSPKELLPVQQHSLPSTPAAANNHAQHTPPTSPTSPIKFQSQDQLDQH